MLKINLFDRNFAHQISSCKDKPQKSFEWYRGEQKISTGAFFTDLELSKAVNSQHAYKYAWILEPPCIYPQPYDYFINNPKENIFTKVFTHQKKLIELNKAKFVFCPTGGCWIDYQDFGVHKKSKLVSTIASEKVQTEGHKLRHEFIKNSGGKVDVYGRAYKYIENKADALKDYMFSVTIENERSDYYFTEKLIDCFVTGTVPIYWGCPSIGKFFDERGIISADSLNSLIKELDNLTEEKYKSMLEYINKNYEIVQDYIIAEDYLFKKYKYIFNIERQNSKE